MTDTHDSVLQKVKAIFTELAGEQANHLFVAIPPATKEIKEAISIESDKKTASDIAFHMSDWTADAAILLAIHLFPERFSNEEIEAGIGLFLVHAPNHVAAAAKLYGHPISDIFELGELTLEKP
ncbi:MAG: hypothetical protein AAF085_09730 [Planctomycetota bacterium]